jgi:hypothetical protein
MLLGNTAVSIAVVTTIGNISGIVAPLIMSGLRGDSDSGNYASGCLFLMACLMTASVCVRLLHAQTKTMMEQKKKVKLDGQSSTQNSHASSTAAFYQQKDQTENEIAEAELELEMSSA